MSSRKINATKNYRLFGGSDENRPLDLKKHRKLRESMERYGFLRSYPIVCYRDKNNNLIVKDGQHRLSIAESLGLTVYWVDEEVDFDVAVVNCTAKVWAIIDYAKKYAVNGCEDYAELMEFAEKHGVPIGTAVCLLGGTTSFSNVSNNYYGGEFKIKNRKWAELVVSIYNPLVGLSPAVGNSRFMAACMGVCHVKEFEPERLLHSAERCRELLVSYSTKDAYLDMIEKIYNFNRKYLVGLKTMAVMEMRKRNAIFVKQDKKKKRDEDTQQKSAG